MQAKSLSLNARIAGLAVALALGAGYAVAAPETAATPANGTQATQAAEPGHHGKRAHSGHGRHGMHGKHMRDAALWVPGYGPLKSSFVDTLGLTDAQKTLVADAESAGTQARTDRRAAMKQAHQARAEQLKAGKLDPKAALAQMQDMHDKARAERSAQDAKWLAVWDALDTAQQEKVAAHLAERAEKFAERAARHQKRQGSDAAKGAAPAAPAPATAS